MSNLLKTEDNVRNWFGDRGIPFDDDSKLKFKVVGNWIFIHDSLDDYDEVELYFTNSWDGECQDGWDRKGFDWSEKNLLKIIKENV